MTKTDFDQWRRDIAQQVHDGLITADEAATHLERIAEREADERKLERDHE